MSSDSDDASSSPNLDSSPQAAALTALDEKHMNRESGNGSNGQTAEYFDQESLYEDQTEGKVRTTFFHWDGDLPAGADREKWERLSQLNHGKGNEQRGQEKWRNGKINDAKLFCNVLEFNEQQTQKVVQMAKDINFDEFGQFSVEQVLLGCCSLVSDENTTIYENRIILDDTFLGLMDAMDIGSKEHRRIRQGIRDRTEYF